MTRVLLLCLSFITFGAFAQNNKPTLDLFGEWNTVFINGYFGDSNWFYNIEQSERNSTYPGQDKFGLAQYVTYDGIGYKINDNHAVSAGFWYQYTQPPYSGRYTQEVDAYERYSYNKKFDVGTLSFRTQLEQRNNISQTNANGTSVRYRQQVKFVYPFTNTNWSAVASEEVFINLNTVNWGPVSGFDQNRAFVGAGYDFNKTLRTEFGYMNQAVYRNLNSMFIDNQLSLNLYVNIPK